MLVFMVLMIVLVLILLGVYNDVDVGLMLIMYEVTVCSYWRNDVRSTKYVMLTTGMMLTRRDNSISIFVAPPPPFTLSIVSSRLKSRG